MLFSTNDVFEIDSPVRGELLSRDSLVARAVELAEFYSASSDKKEKGRNLRARFKRNTRQLQAAYFQFSEASKNKEVLTAGAEWLLDNYHIVDQQVKEIANDLPRSYYRSLPKLTDREWRGFPRVYRVISEFLSHTDSVIDLELLGSFIQAYQSRVVLKIGELWAVPIMLRLCLVENLRRLANSSLTVRKHRIVAEQLCEDVLASTQAKGSDVLVNLVKRVGEDAHILRDSGAYILRRLRSRGSSTGLALQWFDAKLRELNLDPEVLAREEQQAQAADQISFGNCVTSLKVIGSIDWHEWFEKVSHIDRVLSQDRIFPSCDFNTRDLYRNKIERLADRAGQQEVEVAEKLVEFAGRNTGSTLSEERKQHVGYYLVDNGQQDFERQLDLKPEFFKRLTQPLCAWPLFSYLSMILAVTLVFLYYGLNSIKSDSISSFALYAFALAFIFPASEAAILFTQWFVNQFTKPKPLPKLNFEKGISDNYKTLVTVQSILTPHTSIDELLEALEIRALANQDPNLSFGLLLDFQDADVELLSGDRGLINQLQVKIEELNGFYNREQLGSFFALCRKRLWNPSEQKYMGWERKRGKIEEFNHLLLGNDATSFQYIIADLQELRKAKFVITLDNDTKLPPGTARKMVATMAHPLNRPVFDASSRKVVEGYGILQPRMGIVLESALATAFSRAFSGQSGLDPYTQTVSDIYQDVFKEGSYIGKGIYDIQAFNDALDNRVPENALLSHDLFEGCFARCGLLSDVELLDDYPPRYHQQSRRQMRWIRGDWQILPWIFGSHKLKNGEHEKSQLSALSRWKLADNLRRSLVPLGSFVCLLMAALSEIPWSFLEVFLLVLFTPLLLNVVSSVWDLIRQVFQELFEIGSKQSFIGSIVSLWSEVSRVFMLTIYQIIVIPHQAFFSTHAILITLYRVYVSRLHLLEWETALAAQKRLGGDLLSFVKTFAAALVVTALCIFWAGEQGGNAAYLSILFIAWFSAPAVMWQISKEDEAIEKNLSDEDQLYLKDLAFETWGYFNRFLIPEYNYLIPDNLQLVPHRVVAERTSPTNISLSCLSVMSAQDLGFISTSKSISLLHNIFGSLRKLERFHGHFLNWYDIRTLSSLRPRYVSTVDSGNMLGHFIAVKQGLSDILNSGLVAKRHKEFIQQNLNLHITKNTFFVDDLVNLVSQGMKSLAESPRIAADKKTALEAYFGDLKELCSWAENLGILKALADKGILHKRLQNISKLLSGRSASIMLLLKLTNRLLAHETQLTNLQLDSDEKQQLETLIASLRNSNRLLKELVAKAGEISSDIDNYLKEADFKFLTHPAKDLFAIGYNIDSGQQDSSCYDLLASEARLASLVAIAEGKIKTSHWFLLGRALTDSLGGKALLSWSATMFEYLMPLLVMKDYRGTLLNRTHIAVVKAQIAYGNLRAVPWGISESAFSGVDFEKTYQYRAFGLPGLGYKRGLGEDLVISPYSTALALMVDFDSSCRNLRLLEQHGLRGEFGFFEAADYTRERLGADEDKHIIKSFLAHHQGMSLISINNVLNGGIIQRRFHADPKVQAVEILLQERFPERSKSLVPHRAEKGSSEHAAESSEVDRSEKITSPHTQYPYLNVLSNRRYSVFVSNSGSGLSIFDSEYSLNRWFGDALQDCWGQFVYVRDLDTDRFWSTTYQPTRVEAEEYEVIYNPDKIETIRRDGSLRIRQELVVSPEDPVEVKRVNVTNLDKSFKRIELTSFAEIALANDRADKAHLAFSKLFLETEFLPDFDAILVQRKPRTHSEKEVWMFQLVSMPIVWAPLEYETDRSKFIGRDGSYANPKALMSRVRLSKSVGTVLDPCLSLRAIIEVESGFTQQLTFVTGAARNREEAISLIKKYHESYHIARAFEMAWSHADVEIRDQQFTLKRIRTYQRLASALMYNVEALRAPSDIIAKASLPQSALWRLGISGDEPIVLVVISDAEQAKLAEEALLAHEYLRRRGIRFDLIILNESAGGYLQNLRDELDFLVASSYARSLIDQRGGIFIRANNQLSEDEHLLLRSVARVMLSGERGSLSEQIRAAGINATEQFNRKIPQDGAKKVRTDAGSEYANGIGDFTSDGQEYSMVVGPKKKTPQPWSNVVANSKFGFLATERGSGYTWAGNSRENRLTPWSNDPVLDPPSEVLYIRDVETGAFWSATPSPASLDLFCKVKHGFGYSSYELENDGIKSILTITTDTDSAVKYYTLDLQNNAEKERRLELYFYVEWVMGVSREASFRYIQTKFSPSSQIIVAKNPWNAEFSRQQAFIGSNLSVQSFTCSRREFVGRHGDLTTPRLFEKNSPAYGQTLGRAGTLSKPLTGNRSWPVILEGISGAGFDPCGLLKTQTILSAKGKSKALFFLAHSDGSEEPDRLAARYRSLSEGIQVLNKQKEFWQSTLNSVQVKTPSGTFNTIMNGWLLYQTLSCRMLARTGFFQSSGAFGFRDQLQDSLALLWSAPERTRQQLLLHASRQFKEGDVQHWWHPPAGRGIRTRISDNYIWMPYALTRYLKHTKDSSILDEVVGYLDGPVLEEGQMEHYFEPSISNEKDSLYRHCVRALDRALVTGEKGLPLIGCGDWNDGMNQVGTGLKGESVWLAWFLAITLREFAEVALSRGDAELADKYRQHSIKLVSSVEAHSWDGNWYHRAYFDDGTPLGSKDRKECRIDSLSNSWAAISGMADPQRVNTAMQSVYEELVDHENRIIKLLTPAFENSDPSPGYIQGYPAGIRENGGQYTHGATWTVWAFALLGMGDKAFELFQMINPITHADTPEGVAQYQTEPYATCGDVYSHVDHAGRGGWSLYTGSSGWLYQIGLEAILGLKIEGPVVSFDPCIPPDWKEYQLVLKLNGREIAVDVLNPKSLSKGKVLMKVNGQECNELNIDSFKEGEKIQVECRLE